MLRFPRCVQRTSVSASAVVSARNKDVSTDPVVTGKHHAPVSAAVTRSACTSIQKRSLSTRIGRRITQTHIAEASSFSDSDALASGTRRRPQANTRSQLKDSRVVVVKLGSAVITREDECGLALGRLASIVEQVAELQRTGKRVVMVISGAVAVGRHVLSKQQHSARGSGSSSSSSDNPALDTRLTSTTCCAVGQCHITSLCQSLFSKHGLEVAELPLQESDLTGDRSAGLVQTLTELVMVNAIPIVNGCFSMPGSHSPLAGVDLDIIDSIADNDRMAAILARRLHAGMLIYLSDMPGVFTGPPGGEDSVLVPTCRVAASSTAADIGVSYGTSSSVGLGGMKSKVESAMFAARHGVSVVIADGKSSTPGQQHTRLLLDIVSGKQVGTLFTREQSSASCN